MTHILFVDDDQAVLDGLANLFRKQRKHWSMAFAAGGEQALTLLRETPPAHPFDVVVSDMRMPGMDGATLLRHVKDLYPGAVRVVLSGYAERAMVARALSVAHQFVSKPCDVDQLHQVIYRACTLQRVLSSPALRAIAGGIDSLPSVPSLYLELRRAIDGDNTGARDIAAIVERDPAMGAKVLQLASSAFFARPQRLTSIAQAVTVLGVDMLCGLALTAGIFAAAAEAPHIAGFTLQELQDHSLRAALVARELAPSEQRDEAFTTALLHDVGKIVLALRAPGDLAEALASARATGRPLHECERELFGSTHAEVGAYLLGVWGLPSIMVDAVAFHHASEPQGGLAGIVQEANDLVKGDAP